MHGNLRSLTRLMIWLLNERAELQNSAVKRDEHAPYKLYCPTVRGETLWERGNTCYIQNLTLWRTIWCQSQCQVKITSWKLYYTEKEWDHKVGGKKEIKLRVRLVRLGLRFKRLDESRPRSSFTKTRLNLLTGLWSEKRNRNELPVELWMRKSNSGSTCNILKPAEW